MRFFLILTSICYVLKMFHGGLPREVGKWKDHADDTHLTRLGMLGPETSTCCPHAADPGPWDSLSLGRRAAPLPQRPGVWLNQAGLASVSRDALMRL